MSNTLDNNQPSPAPVSDADDPGSSRPLNVEVTVDAGVSTRVQPNTLAQAARAAANFRGYTCGEIGIRITDDDQIRKLNAQHLQHDYETDVISFPYRCDGDLIEGELVAQSLTICC